MAAFSSRGPGGLCSSPTSPLPACRSWPATRRCRRPVEGPARRVLPGHRRHLDVVAAHGRRGHPAGRCTRLDARPDEVGPDDDGDTEVVKEDLTTPADPFDIGAGRIDSTPPAPPGCRSTRRRRTSSPWATDPVNAVHLNIPSINAPVLAGSTTTARTLVNRAAARSATRDHEAPAGSHDHGDARRGSRVAPGQSHDIDDHHRDRGSSGGSTSVRSTSLRGAAKLPSTCRWLRRQPGRRDADQTVTPPRSPATRPRVHVTATNNTSADHRRPAHHGGNNSASSRSPAPTGSSNRTVELIRAARGADPASRRWLRGRRCRLPPARAFGVTPIPIGDEEILNFNVPAFVYTGETYTVIGVDSNGYSSPAAAQ